MKKNMSHSLPYIDEQSQLELGSLGNAQGAGRTATFETVLRFKRRLLSFLGVLVLSLVLPHAALASPNLVQNGGFETGDFTGWTLSGNIGGAFVSNNDPHSGQFAADFAPAGDFVYLTQDLQTTPGVEYNLLFWYWSHDRPPTEMQVFWNGQMIVDQLDPGTVPWTQAAVNNLLATGGQTELTFGFLTSDAQSLWKLDDVSVTPQTTPEPGSILLLGSGILGIAGILRRKLVG